MDPLSPLSQRILRFQGVQPKVLQALEPDRINRIKKDSQDLFGETVDVFIKRADQAENAALDTENATIDLVSNSKNSRALHYISGVLSSLHGMTTGQYIKPVEIVKKNTAPKNILHETSSGDIFQRSIRSDN